jgi:long-subunit fatty acid transport protein
MKRVESRPVLFLLVLSLFAAESFADQLHYNNILIGDRAAGLGGAYSAISDDASGLYYNPAGIVFSNELQLSASANAMHSSTLTYKNVVGGFDWVRKSSSIVPNFFGMTTKLGKGYFGFSYAITDFQVEDQDSLFTDIPNVDSYIVNLINTDKVSKLGPSYAIQVNDQLNIGATLYLHNRDKDLVFNQFVRASGGVYESSNQFDETAEIGIEPILGFIWTPHKEWSIGATIRKVVIVSSTSRSQLFCASDLSSSTGQCAIVSASIRNPTVTTHTSKRELPLNLRVGVAYFPSPRFLVSADMSHFGSVSSDTFKAEAVVNFALGVEFYINPKWAIRGGYFTNQSNTPNIDPTLDPTLIIQDDHVDLSGISFSVTKFSKTSSITVGYSGSSGSGEAQVIAGSNAVQDLEQSVNTLYLSTSYSF